MPRSSKRGSANISVFWSPMPIVTWWGAGAEGAAAAGAATTSASARTSTRAGIREPSLVTKAPRRRGGATCTAPKGRRRARRFASGDRPARALRVEPARRARQQRRQGAAHAAAVPWWPPAGRRVLVPGAGRGRVLRSGVDEADVDEAGGRHCGSSLVAVVGPPPPEHGPCPGRRAASPFDPALFRRSGRGRDDERDGAEAVLGALGEDRRVAHVSEP